jgi:hypothetical protein
MRSIASTKKELAEASSASPVNNTILDTEKVELETYIIPLSLLCMLHVSLILADGSGSVINF